MTVRSQREDNDIPVATQAVSLRYAGLPSTVTLPVPSKHGFIAMKCLAYGDRHAPRDLLDFAHLALVFTTPAVQIVTPMSGAHLTHRSSRRSLRRSLRDSKTSCSPSRQIDGCQGSPR